MDAGDILVVPHGDPYCLADSRGRRVRSSDEEAVWFFRKMAAGELPSIVTEGGGGPEKTTLICGFLGCDARPFNPILAALPRVIHLRGATQPRRPMSHLIEFAVGELRARRAGSREVLLRLSELMFIEVVRCHLETRTDTPSDWLAGLRDPLVARVLSRCTGSRRARGRSSAGRRRRRVAIGTGRALRVARRPAPMRYLAAWRMQLATRLLDERGRKVQGSGRRGGLRIGGSVQSRLQEARRRRADGVATTRRMMNRVAEGRPWSG